MGNDIPASLLEAVRYFSDLTLCHHYMRKVKWPDGKAECPKCGAPVPMFMVSQVSLYPFLYR